jgi:hypothetical protein
MSRHRRLIPKRVERRRAPFAERFAAAAALYGPELMLLLKVVPASSRGSAGDCFTPP